MTAPIPKSASGLARAEALATAANNLPKPAVSQVEIAAAANEWGRHVVDLRKESY
jgi:hypothetical protein